MNDREFLIHCIVSQIKELPVSQQVRWLIIAEQLALLHKEASRGEE